MKYYVTGWHSRYGHRTAIVGEGPKRLHICYLDAPVTVLHTDKDEARRFYPLKYKGKPYPLARACRQYRAFAKRGFGITKTAEKLLTAALEAAKENTHE